MIAVSARIIAHAGSDVLGNLAEIGDERVDVEIRERILALPGFLLGAGAGLDAAITAKVKSGRGKTSSVWIWVRPAIETILTYRYPEVRVTVDGTAIGYLYNFVHAGRVCNYQSGFDYGDGSLHERPGIVCHVSNPIPNRRNALSLF